MRAEPRSMTLIDGLGLVAGFALSIGAIEGPKLAFMGITPGLMLFFFAITIVQRTTLAVSIVVLGRVASYRRMPRSLEWLLLLIAASAVSNRPELQVDEMVNQVLAAFHLSVDGPLSFSSWRWAIAGLISVPILVGLGVLWHFRRRFPPIAKTLGLTGLGLAALVGPFSVLSLEGANLITPSGGFGPGNVSIFYREVCNLTAEIPIGIFFGIPLVVSLSGWLKLGRKGRIWTEWASVVLTTTILFFFGILHQFEFNQLSAWWLAERLVWLVWSVVIVLSSRWIVRWIGPHWDRWTDDPAFPAQKSSSSDELSRTL